MKSNAQGKVILGMIILSGAVNTILHNRLPDEVALQITRGQLGNFVPKTVALVGVPVLLLVLWFLERIGARKDSSKYVLVSGIVLAASFVMLVLNLR